MNRKDDTQMSTKTENTRDGLRWLLLAGLVVAIFAGAYAFASGRGPSAPTIGTSSGGAPGVGTQGVGTASGAAAGSGATPACACCGSSAPTKGGVTGNTSAGAAAVAGGVQKISVDLSKGYYDPNVITLAAGVPAEITFGQSSGCTGQVISQDLGFSEDLTAGPRTVRIDSPQKGTYAFSCGMQMVFGKIVVE
jgi:hypothetical protein